jgi:hypothetical protein
MTAYTTLSFVGHEFGAQHVNAWLRELGFGEVVSVPAIRESSGEPFTRAVRRADGRWVRCLSWGWGRTQNSYLQLGQSYSSIHEMMRSDAIAYRANGREAIDEMTKPYLELLSAQAEEGLNATGQ